jgi:hypothetical protein
MTVPRDASGRGRTDEPVRIGVQLDRILEGLGAPPAGVLTRLVEEWPAVVGPAVAAHTWVIGVDGDRLLIGVDEPAYATHVRYLDGAVRAWVDDVVGPGNITRVDARVRPRGGPAEAL